jgi:hypothetical protein
MMVCRVECMELYSEWGSVSLLVSLLVVSLYLPHTALAQRAIINIEGHWR